MSAAENNQNTYNVLGASSTKEEVHKAIAKLDRGIYTGAFCKLIADPAGDPDWCAAMHADGAGTKSSLAYLMFRETGDFSVWRGIAQDSLVMNLDDILCVGATSGFVISNTIDRNAHLVDGRAITEIIAGYADFIDTLSEYGIDIQMSGGETADVGDLARTVIVNSTLFMRMRREDVVNCDNIRPGDVIVGLASYGQCRYEKSYNAGMGSNGLTAARHLLLSNEYAEKYPETYSPTIPKEKVYCGSFNVTDPLPGTGVSVGAAILSPTRTYAPVIKDILDSCRPSVHGIIHCTGGGLVKCRGFGHGVKYVKDDLIDVPPLFRAVYETGSISLKEMYQTFNMGCRLEIILPESAAYGILEIARKYEIQAKIVGRVEAQAEGDANSVEIHDRIEGRIFRY
ncbi:MAG: phosphoribosylformylglycinamidine cyclo-ligase [Clostridiales bacterium]|jgi:phosphoribosylformylglycinamidine cyclo-ligase|nr:phosphoribosylformylglycinamidine cyclo-ligase [Clostridiales bacterium]